MSIRKVTPDLQQARSLLSSAQSFIRSIEPIKNTAEGTFLINIEYDILHSICGAILAYDGEKLTGKDHHRILIERVCDKYKFTLGQKHLFDEFRKIRNDINYYGQREKSFIEDFYQRNKIKIWEIRASLLKIITLKLSN